MTAPTTLRQVIARTVHDGPVVLGQYETVTGQRRAYRDALATLRDGGFDGDVVGIELDSGVATDTQTVATIERTQARLKGM